MNRLLTILLLLGATAAHGQINNPPTSVNIVDSTATGRAVLTATNAAAAATAIGLGAFKNPDNYAELLNASGQTVLDVEDSVAVYRAIDWAGTNSETYKGATRTNLGLGATNNVTFSNITASGTLYAKDSTASPATNSSLAKGIQWTNLAGFHAAIYGNYVGTPQLVIAAGASNSFSDVATFRSTGMTVNSNAVVGGTLAVSNTATFSTNVTVNGNISVGSLTTTTPSTWALDATQTAAATNGILALPSNANVIRLTNNNAISSVTNGVLGAFYYLVNQATNAVTISNVGGITVDGAQNLTLSPNESATLVATGATNASVANRGDLNNVTLTGDTVLSGVNNTMPNATNAASASSLMTRDLVAQRLPFQLINYDPVTSAMGAVTSSNGGSGTPSVNKFDLRTGTNSNGVSVWGAASGGGLGLKSAGRGSVAWQGRISVGWYINRILTNTEVRLQFGKDQADRTFSSLTNKGVGIYISNTSVFFETHDGTNHFQTTNSLTTSLNESADSWMAVTQNGVASFYKNGTLITDVTNNVPKAQDATAAYGYVIGVQNTSTNNGGIRIFTTPGFILQD